MRWFKNDMRKLLIKLNDDGKYESFHYYTHKPHKIGMTTETFLVKNYWSYISEEEFNEMMAKEQANG